LFLTEFIDLTNPKNLHWLAVLGSSIILTLASSLVPNYVETTLDMRSHNRARLFNETAARLHIAYIIFLLTLITSDDIDKTGNTIVWLDTLTIIVVFILMWSTIVSGRTLKRIRNTRDRNGSVHQCRVVNGICHKPVGRWIGFKVCYVTGLTAFIIGIICLLLAVNPSLIKRDQSLHQNVVSQSQLKAYDDALRAMYKRIAHRTKDEFEEKALVIREDRYKDDKLNVSYWLNYDGSIRQLATTHEASAGDVYEIKEESIIGCGFVYQNSSVRWDDWSKQAIVWPYNDEPKHKDSCKYAELQIAKIKSIVCATYNGSGVKNPEHTVGICVFTTGVVRNVANNDNYHEFLKTKAEEFYNSVFPLLKSKTLIQQ
jgi:hypothetical protein